MSESHSTPPTDPGKPAKPSEPYVDYPLGVHPHGYWCKRIRGVYYFGPRFDASDQAAATAAADAALTEYLKQRTALHAGRKPRHDPDALTVKDTCNALLNANDALVEAGELSPRTMADYQHVCDLLESHLGKARLVNALDPSNFADQRNQVAKRWGPHRLGSKLIPYTRSVFRHALDAGLSDRPVCFGPASTDPPGKYVA